MGPRSWRDRALWAAAFLGLYLLATRSTQSLTMESGFTAWYLPAGVAFAYLLLVGPTAAVEVLFARLISIAIFVTDAWRDEPDGVITRAFAITACYTVGAWFLRQGRLRQPGARELGWFTVIGVFAVPMGAALSVALVSVALLGESGSIAWESARTVWIGDAIAIATIVPPVMLLNATLKGRMRRPRLPTTRWERVELALQVVSLVAGPVVALVVAHDQDATGYLSFAVLPILWVALRGDMLVAAIGLFLVNTSLTVASSGWLGATTRMSELQAVMLAAALVALYVAAVTQTERDLVARLRASEQRYRNVIDNVPSLVVQLDTRGEPVFVNEPDWFDSSIAVEDVVAPLRDDWVGLEQALLAGGVVERSWEAEGRDGESHWFAARLRREVGPDGEPQGVMALVTDLTPSLRAEAELARVRWGDPLTGLINRARFIDLLDPMVARAAPRLLGVAAIDIDGFKRINESAGHAAGDAVLVEASRQLAARVGDSGFAARLTADEFAIALPVEGPEDAAALGEELVRELRMRIPVDDHDIAVTFSVGVAWGDLSRDAVQILYDAESALHAAKESGGDRSSTFETGLRVAALERERRLALLNRALEAGDLVLHFQPIFDLETDRIVGAEALVRIRDTDGELLFPGVFMDVVEAQHLDLRLGELVLDQALAALATWRSEAGADDIYVAVNVTARHLTQPGFLRQVLSVCRKHDVPPQRLRIEITETLVMADLEAAVRTLESLRVNGVTAALDDFGVGYSSMAYLQRLPVDLLKIDQRFVAGLPDDDDDRSIVGLVVGLAQALGIGVTAEGIETEEQRADLLELGCRLGQGFLLARPEDSAAMTARLRSSADLRT